MLALFWLSKINKFKNKNKANLITIMFPILIYIHLSKSPIKLKSMLCWAKIHNLLVFNFNYQILDPNLYTNFDDLIAMLVQIQILYFCQQPTNLNHQQVLHAIIAVTQAIATCNSHNPISALNSKKSIITTGSTILLQPK